MEKEKKLDESISLVFSEKSKPKEKIGKGAIEEQNVYAKYTHKCKSCGYDKAQILDLGVWVGDEDHVFRLKCGKCGFTEQLEGKVT